MKPWELGRDGKSSSQESRSSGAPGQDQLRSGTAGATASQILPSSCCPPGVSEALLDIGRLQSSKPPPPPPCLASMDDLFRHATPSCFAASLQALYCFWPGLATSPHPSLTFREQKGALKPLLLGLVRISKCSQVLVVSWPFLTSQSSFPSPGPFLALLVHHCLAASSPGSYGCPLLGRKPVLVNSLGVFCWNITCENKHILKISILNCALPLQRCGRSNGSVSLQSDVAQIQSGCLGSVLLQMDTDLYRLHSCLARCTSAHCRTVLPPGTAAGSLDFEF